jgi:UDP-N-acetylglucosamine--N-acetylmuramyl-(pentapeptide) pyrophosphoryl-undecaprenol N-acetylglucosamine transferase
LGGSLGARPINDVVPRMLRRLARSGDTDWEVWHQTGDAHIEAMQAAYRDLDQTRIRVAPYIEDMAAAYAWADLVLCRAGALTVSELAVTGRPSILVPLPHAIDDHQTANARSLTARGAAIMLLQTQLDAYMLGNMVREFRNQPERLAAMAAAARGAALPDAAARASDCCEELMRA